MSRYSEPIGFAVTPRMKRRIDAQLDYGETRSEWLRDTVSMRLEDADPVPVPPPEESEFVG